MNLAIACGIARLSLRRSVVMMATMSAVIAGTRLLKADALDDIQQRGVLAWGADQEGGGPYVFADPDDPDRLIGFEVELAELLAEHLGVKAQFCQKNWDTLPQFLNAGEVDIILNGYEWSPERAALMEATRPYYIYELQLLVKADDTRIASWEDLKHPPENQRYTVGVLEPSAAATYVRKHLDDRVKLRLYDGNTNAMMQVAGGADDATLQDLPIALFYRDRPQGRGLRFVDQPVGRGYYVMFARRGEQRLVNALNEALEQSLHDGRLKTIYDRYHLWNNSQEALLSAAPLADAAQAVHGWDVIHRYAPTLLRAAWTTILISITAMPLAIIIGLLVALGRLYAPQPLPFLLGIYVEILRGTPVMLQLFFIFFLLPQILPFALSPIVAAIIGLAINYSAYESEIYRAGLQAIPPGQMDAALALGMSRRTALRRVIVPQAVRLVIPPVTNDFIALFKDTSVCSVIAVTELTKQYNILVNGTGAVVELAALTAVIYLLMSYPLAIVARRMERRLERSGAEAVA